MAEGGAERASIAMQPKTDGSGVEPLCLLKQNNGKDVTFPPPAGFVFVSSRSYRYSIACGKG